VPILKNSIIHCSIKKSFTERQSVWVLCLILYTRDRIIYRHIRKRMRAVIQKDRIDSRSKTLRTLVILILRMALMSLMPIPRTSMIFTRLAIFGLWYYYDGLGH
jgi:hypothetical protein